MEGCVVGAELEPELVSPGWSPDSAAAQPQQVCAPQGGPCHSRPLPVPPRTPPVCAPPPQNPCPQPPTQNLLLLLTV